VSVYYYYLHNSLQLYYKFKMSFPIPSKQELDSFLKSLDSTTDLPGIDFHRNFDSLTRTINHINNFHMSHTQTLHKNLLSKIDVMRQLNTKEESFKKLIARGEIAQAKKRSQSNKENGNTANNRSSRRLSLPPPTHPKQLQGCFKDLVHAHTETK